MLFVYLLFLVLSSSCNVAVTPFQIADRLHNMRTIWALSDVKQRALAEETLAVWCNLASRLGLASLKAELEDLAFCVLNPDKFVEIQRGIEL